MSAGHVYVIAFDNGIVKVGRTKNVPNRMRAHRADGRKFGIAITDSWSSPLHTEWEPNEDELKSIASKHGGTPIWTGAEYHTGADYAEVVNAAARLPFTPPSREEEIASVPVPVDPEKLRMRRIRARLYAADLARLTGLNYSYIGLIEHGKRRPSPRTLNVLAAALDCDITDLMPDAATATAA